jgi:hypothetical protein
MRSFRPHFWLVLIALASYGCGSSRNAAGTGNTDEMNRIQSAFGDLQNDIDTSASKQEFAQKVNDALARVGDLENSEKVAEVGLPKDKVALVYGYFGREEAAYVMSTEFFGDRLDDLRGRTDSASDAEKESVSLAFPEIYDFDTMSRRNIMRDLSKVAQGERETASEMIKTL